MSHLPSFSWSERKALWYLRAVRYSDYPLELLRVILPLLKGCRSVLDLGAGCGAFALPLARVVPSVTALEPSAGMAALLHKEVRRLALTNVELIEAGYQEAEVAPHDAVLCAFVHEATGELDAFLPWVRRIAKRRVVLARFARTGEDKLFLRELAGLVGAEPPRERGDYLEAVVGLYERGVRANVRMVDFRLDQPFDDLDEAVSFWREYLELEDDRHDGLLREFLAERLIDADGGLVAPVRHTGAVIWWDVE